MCWFYTSLSKNFISALSYDKIRSGSIKDLLFLFKLPLKHSNKCNIDIFTSIFAYILNMNNNRNVTMWGDFIWSYIYSRREIYIKNTKVFRSMQHVSKIIIKLLKCKSRVLFCDSFSLHTALHLMMAKFRFSTYSTSSTLILPTQNNACK